MPPVTDYYLKHAEKYVTKDALYERVFSNPKVRPYIYKHLDYLDFYAKDHALFVDGEHLNHDGATLFSKQIAPELSKVIEEIEKGSWRFNRLEEKNPLFYTSRISQRNIPTNHAWFDKKPLLR